MSTHTYANTIGHVVANWDVSYWQRYRHKPHHKEPSLLYLTLFTLWPVITYEISHKTRLGTCITSIMWVSSICSFGVGIEWLLMRILFLQS